MSCKEIAYMNVSYSDKLNLSMCAFYQRTKTSTRHCYACGIFNAPFKPCSEHWKAKLASIRIGKIPINHRQLHNRAFPNRLFRFYSSLSGMLVGPIAALVLLPLLPL